MHFCTNSFPRSTPLFLSTVACLSLLSLVPAQADIKLSLQEKGVQIEATGLGKSLVEYPALSPVAGATARKALETRVEGNTATIKYDGGGQIQVDVSTPGQILYRLADIPEDTRTYQLKMKVDFGMGPNRRWKVGEKSGEFPLEKPSTPHLFQGNASNFTLTNYENRSITLTVPDFSYVQLTDTRQWGWNAHFLQVNSPYNKNWKQFVWKVAETTQGEVQKVTLVDKFGQSTQSEWPAKVTSVADLKSDIETEKEFLAGLKAPELDKFGGLPGSREKLGLKATGFFHVEQKSGKWILVNPEGNAFFHLGVCVFGPGDDYTTTKGREQIYEWIPSSQGEFGTAFRPTTPGVFSYHLANQIRKYGEPYQLDSYVARMVARTRKLGFNSAGAFSSASISPATVAANFPVVASLPLGQWDAKIKAIPGTHGIFDPFDPANRDKVEASFAKTIAARAQDPLLIGYFLANEPLYEDIPKVVPSLKGTEPAKQRLVQMLKEKYGNIAAFNTAWEASATSFEELQDAGLAVKTRTASEDVQAYTGLFLEEYFKLVTETFRKYDKNHLLIGNRLQSGTINNEQLCRIMGKYLDVVSFNYYTYAFDKALLTRLHNWTGKKPMMLTEFYWSSPKDSGMSSRQDVSSQRERGLAYRNYVEQAAALGFVVGIEWFTLVDQATTGRWFSGFNGEAANTGLISVADRLWQPAVEEMSKTNFGIYDVWLGNKQPFVFQDARFSAAAGGTKTLPISRATGPIVLDGVAQNWPGIPAEPISSSRLVSGSPVDGFEASFKLCWDETNLYVLANILDGSPMKNAEANNRLWNGDGLELFLGSEKVGEGGPLLFTDRQILLGGGKSNQVYFANTATQFPASTAVVPGTDGKSYTIEAAIPWTSLGLKPADNLELMFDLAVDDGDGTGRKRQLMWNGGAKNSSDRSHWGRARLVR